MPSALAHYESFLVNNVSVISSVESTLRSITWVLPGRFKDAELVSEALSSLLNVTSLYHDTILAKVVKSDPKLRPLIPSSLHTRYTRAWCEKSATYKWAARALEVIKFVQLLVEMNLRRRVSSKARWRGVVFIEAIKAALRLILLRITRRPLLTMPIPDRDFDPEILTAHSESSSPTLAPSSPPSSMPSTPEHLKNNHVSLELPHPLLLNPPAPSPYNVLSTPAEEHLMNKALTPSSVKNPTALMRPLRSPVHWLAEGMYILRPLIYAVLLSSDRKTNRPLYTALIFEFLARHFRRHPTTMSTLERSEYSHRDLSVAWYLLRGSIWQQKTRPKLNAFAERTAQTPVIGVLSAFIKDWIPLIDEYHYYTAP